MFSALLSISKQAFSMQISEPRWNKASYLEANSYFLPGKGWGAVGGCERRPSTTFAVSYSKQGVSVRKMKKAGLAPDN